MTSQDPKHQPEGEPPRPSRPAGQADKNDWMKLIITVAIALVLLIAIISFA
jgi:hypothetical protein